MTTATETIEQLAGQKYKYGFYTDIEGKIAAAANAHKVVLTHMYPICENVDLVGACRQQYGGKIELAEDLQRLRI